MEFFKTVLMVVAGVVGAGLIFLALYGATQLLPGKWRARLQAFPFLIFALIFAVGGLFISAVRTLIASMLNDTGKKFVGIENYREIFREVDTRLSIVNSFTWVFVGTAITVFFGLMIARFSDGMRGERLVKTMVFLPVAISLVGAGITWKFIYAERGFSFKAGLLNEITKAAHLPASMGGGNDGRNWLLERGIGAVNPPSWGPGFNTFLLIAIFIWAQTGIATVVLSAAIKGVPQELIEAATVDGATSNEVFRRVTIPYIKGTIATVTTLAALASLKAFDTVAAATGGNFGTSTIANEFYKKFFVQDRNGIASALAVSLFVLCFPIVVWNRRVQRRVEETN
jgi:alpha-glucoside transport system permease protein